MSATRIVRDHGGKWCGSYGLVPGPGHSPRDRSLKVWEADGQVYVHSFAGDAWKDCRAYLGLEDQRKERPALSRAASPATAPAWTAPATPSRRVLDLLRTAAPVDLVPDAVGYLQHRKLWPLPPGCTLKAHAGAPYYSNGAYIGRFPALLGKVCDSNGTVVTVHVTYLQDNRKLRRHRPVPGTPPRTRPPAQSRC
jgi:hypothetical protein